MSKMGLRSSATPSVSKTTTSAYENKGSLDSMSSYIPKITNIASNMRKRKRKTRNSIEDHKTASPHRVHCCSKDQLDLSRTEERKVAPIASRIPSAVQDFSTSQIDGRGENSTESKLDDADDVDDEVVFRIRRDLVQLGAELRENARKQIRCIGQVEEINESHIAIDASPDR